MKITLPYPPSANRYLRVFRSRTVLSAEAKQYKRTVGAILAKAGWKPTSGPIAYTANVYRPLKSGDLDNRLKVLGDALTGFAWVDDKQVVELHAYRHDDKDNPRVEMEIVALADGPPRNAPSPAVMNPCKVCGEEAVAGIAYCEGHRLIVAGGGIIKGGRKGALKPKPKMQSAHRAAKKMEEAMPKTYQEKLDAAGAVDLRDNMRMEHLGNGYSRAVPIDPDKRHGQPRGVEGELQPLKVRAPPRVETCLCGHPASDHWDGERSCDASEGCPCATFIERR
jgi:crossover junction endodeoxyribonuclease RusA